jgi:transcriptional regulator with XRE-family HTH domain
MPRKIVANPTRRKQIAALRASGLTLAKIARRFGVTKQSIQFALHMGARRIHCRVCNCEVNPAGAMARDDREVFCLTCLAESPYATFGEHLQAYRIAAGLRIVELSNRTGVSVGQISAYEMGRVGSASWSIQCRLFRALGVRLTMEPGD